MLLQKHSRGSWSKKDIEIIAKYRQRIKDIEELNLQTKIKTKDNNSLDFYDITPKEQLPKFLQKMKFQTLHSKQSVGKAVKVYKKQRQTSQQAIIRKKLKDQGQVMFLSQVYHKLGQPLQLLRSPLHSLQKTKSMQTFGEDLQEWQKNRNNAIIQKLYVIKRRNPLQNPSPRHRQSRIIEQKLSQLHRKNSTGRIVNYFKQGSNHKKEIERQLDIIFSTHSSQSNQVNKYVLIENSSKLLKNQLEQRKSQVQNQIKSKLKILNETRIQHHDLFEEKTRLLIQQRQYSNEIQSKQQYGLGLNLNGNSSFVLSGAANKLSQLKTQKCQQVEQNQIKIIRNKRLIQSLQNGILNLEDQLRSIMVGQISYYKMSLKIGMDCRDTGLGWILKKMRAMAGGEKDSVNANPTHKQEEHEFPLYLDKKSKQFLIVKTQLQDQLQQLLQQKRMFVSQIGQSSNGKNNQNSKSLVNKTTTNHLNNGWSGILAQDKIIQDQDSKKSDIPKKYRKTLRKITMLDQQYAMNQNLLQFKPRKESPKKDVQLSTNTGGLSGKKLYHQISQKIKFFDFSKTKKDKSLVLKNSKLLEYQNLLNSIKEVHIKLQDLDIQHQNHLVNHYKESKEVFFIQCAACFGYKKSYTLIIKHFSWKNSGDEIGNAV